MARISYDNLVKRLRDPSPELLKNMAHDLVILTNAVETAREMARLGFSLKKIEIYLARELGFLENFYD